MTRVWLITGETSGDRIGAGIARSFREVSADVQIAGVVGPALREAGVHELAPMEALSAVGLVEGARVAPAALRTLRMLRGELKEQPPDVVVTIDAPSFARRVGRMCRRAGVPVVHVVAPQVWAWRRGRAKGLDAWCSALACLLPFEPAWFSGSGVPAVYVGHPALELPRQASSEPVVLLAPGSRTAEVRRLSPVLERVGERLLAERRVDEVVWLQAPGVQLPAGVRAVSSLDEVRPAVAIAASGTVTLELAARGVPQVVVYQLHAVSAAVARRVLQVRFVALPNVLAGQRLVPEHLQDLDEHAISADASALVGDAGRRQVAELQALLPRPRGGVGAGVVALAMRLLKA